jgi:Ca2+/H+ antiporter
VALLVLLPETVAARGAAHEMQESLNLALGSSLATIGLTRPAVTLLAIALDRGLGARHRHARHRAAGPHLAVSLVTCTNILPACPSRAVRGLRVHGRRP